MYSSFAGEAEHNSGVRTAQCDNQGVLPSHHQNKIVLRPFWVFNSLQIVHWTSDQKWQFDPPYSPAVHSVNLSEAARIWVRNMTNENRGKRLVMTGLARDDSCDISDLLWLMFPVMESLSDRVISGPCSLLCDYSVLYNWLSGHHAQNTRNVCPPLGQTIHEQS